MKLTRIKVGERHVSMDVNNANLKEKDEHVHTVFAVVKVPIKSKRVPNLKRKTSRKTAAGHQRGTN